jgi:hypothetical protein
LEEAYKLVKVKSIESSRVLFDVILIDTNRTINPLTIIDAKKVTAGKARNNTPTCM